MCSVTLCNASYMCNTFVMDCIVCCEKITKRNVEVTCGFCDYSCCRSCVQGYILSKPVIPACMNCNHEWNNKFLMDVCTKTFINKEYRRHREQFLFELEQARFPETQQFIHNIKMCDLFEKEANASLQNFWEKKQILGKLNPIFECKIYAEVEKESNYFLKKYNDAEREHQRLKYLINNEILETTETVDGGYKRRCPLDGCRGFLNKKWKCGICDKKICSKCNELKLPEHTCNPDNVATAKLIKSDSRPCPRCGIYIQKLEGCDQMWCTDCHTAFNWRSGQVVTGRIHNPHFFEVRRAAGIVTRNLNDIPCGGLPTQEEFINAGFSNPHSFPMVLIHLVCYIDGKVKNMTEPNNLKMRIKYLQGDIDEIGFKRAICTADKKYHKSREIDDVYRMASTIISDILRQLVLKDVDMTVTTAEQQIVDILNYSNNILSNISNKYGSKADSKIYCNYNDHFDHETFRFEVGKTFYMCMK